MIDYCCKINEADNYVSKTWLVSNDELLSKYYFRPTMLRDKFKSFADIHFIKLQAGRRMRDSDTSLGVQIRHNHNVQWYSNGFGVTGILSGTVHLSQVYHSMVQSTAARRINYLGQCAQALIPLTVYLRYNPFTPVVMQKQIIALVKRIRSWPLKVFGLESVHQQSTSHLINSVLTSASF